MILRGTIASITSQGSGVVLVNGSQFPFVRERLWQSAEEPQVGMEVGVTFSPEMGITRIEMVAPVAAQPVDSPAIPVASGLANPLELVDLVAVLAAAVAWFVLPAVNVHLPWLEIHLTFWQVLGHSDALESILTSGGVEPLGLAMQIGSILCLFAALLPLVWRVRWAKLGGVLPLTIMVVVAVAVQHAFSQALNHSTGFFSELGRALVHEIQQQMRPGLGTWIAAPAVLWLAGHSIWRFVRNKQ